MKRLKVWWINIKISGLSTIIFIGDMAYGTKASDAWLAGVFFGACAALILQQLF